MLKRLSLAFALLAALLFSAQILLADGCYICKGKSGSYVKFKGSDTFDKRKKAKDCGCDVGGTTSSCNAANYKILCTVAFNDEGKKILICKK